MKNTLLALCALCLIAACKKSDNDPSGSITGFVKMKMGNDSIGVGNIRLYLLDANATIDTAKCNNKLAFADSVLTKTDGTYSFNKVKPGKYSVVPKYKPGYKITPIGRAFDQLIELGEEEKVTINFIDEINEMSSNLYLSIRINFLNMKQSSYPAGPVVARYRRTWVLFVPYMQYVSTIATYNRTNWNNGTFSCSCQADIPRALTFLFYSWDNLITFDLINSDNESVPSPVVESIQCFLPFEKGSAYIQYDGSTKSVTVTK